MIDLVIAYLALMVVFLLFIVVFLTLYIVYDRRKTLSLPSSLNEKNRLVPLFALQSSGGPSGDHSNSSALSNSTKRTSKRIRYRPSTVLIRKQNSKGFLVSPSDLFIQNKNSNAPAKSRRSLTHDHFTAVRVSDMDVEC